VRVKFDPRIRIYSEQTQEEMVQYFSRFAEMMDAAPASVEQLRGWIIKGVEIFKAGTYRGIPYSESSLDEMAANFKALKDSGTFEPVFKKDHSESVEDQIGWIVNVYREGDLLKGDIHVTEWMAMDKIESKTWKFVSSEIYPPELAAEEFGDAVSGHVLRGVAIVSIPKVKGLKGIVLNSEIIEIQGGNIVNREQIEALMKKLGMFSEEEIKGFSDEEIFAKFSENIGGYQKPAVVVAPGTPAAPATFGEGHVVIKAEDFEAMVQKAAGAEKQSIDLFAEVTALKNESKSQKVERKISALMKAGKVTPAEKEGIMEFAEGLEGEALDKYFNTFEKRAAVVDFSEGGGGQGGSSDDDDAAWAAFQEMKGKKTFE
jgi:phage I-like protein